MKGRLLQSARLSRAEQQLTLALNSGYLCDRRGKYFGDIDADARVFAAIQLVRQAIKIQKESENESDRLHTGINTEAG